MQRTWSFPSHGLGCAEFVHLHGFFAEGLEQELPGNRSPQLRALWDVQLAAAMLAGKAWYAQWEGKSRGTTATFTQTHLLVRGGARNTSGTRQACNTRDIDALLAPPWQHASTKTRSSLQACYISCPSRETSSLVCHGPAPSVRLSSSGAARSLAGLQARTASIAWHAPLPLFSRPASVGRI